MAAARAFGGHIYRHKRIVDDPLASEFLSPPIRRRLQSVRQFAIGPLRPAVGWFYNLQFPGALGWALARHRYIDDNISDSVSAGIRQLVLIGAGYDSRVFRLPALAQTSVLEIDHPNTQASKLRILRDLHGTLPPNVTYAGFDAATDDLATIWRNSLDTRNPTVVVLEGLLWYLPLEVGSRLLGTISSLIARGSLIIFDYILPSQVNGTCDLEGARQHRDFVSRVGEPIQSGIEPHDLPAYLRSVGLHLIDDVTAADLTQRYGRIKMHPFFHIARAAPGQNAPPTPT